MGENFSFIASPLKATKIIDDGPLSVKQILVDELDEVTPGNNIIANKPVVGSGTSMSFDDLQVNTLLARDSYGVSLVATLASGTGFTLFEKSDELSSEAELPDGGVVALITVPDWVALGSVLKLTADLKNSDVGAAYCYLKVLEVATFPALGDIIPYAGYIAAVSSASTNTYVSKTVDVTVGSTRKWAIVIHSEAAITGLAFIKDLVLSADLTSYAISGGAPPFKGCL